MAMYSLAYVTTVASNYWKTDRYKFESSQRMKAERSRQIPQAGHEGIAFFVIVFGLWAVTLFGRWCPPDILPSAIHSWIMLYIRTLNTDQKTETVVRRMPWAVCSTQYAMPMCDIIIFSTISRMLRSDTVVVIIIPYARWWSWARLCCVWKLPILSQRPVIALTQQLGGGNAKNPDYEMWKQ